MRLNIIRNEVLNNIPKYNVTPNDLYINIRSGDIFINAIHRDYAQPPLCFYHKIIKENNYSRMYIVSNGHENPVVDKLLKFYPKIKYVHDSIKGDISIIVNAYNLIMPESTFPWTLIRLNNNLKNLYYYELTSYDSRKDYELIIFDLSNIKCNIHIMKSSLRYQHIMKNNWLNSMEQLKLMLNENCSNKLETIFQ